MAFSALRALLRKLFSKKKIPTCSARRINMHLKEYICWIMIKNKQEISRKNFMSDLPLWAQYMEFLSGKTSTKRYNYVCD